MKIRIALYARVSTKDKGQDYENQLLELRQFVAHKAGEGWTVVHEYVDKASGKTADRPAFRQMFEDASRKKFDLVLFWSLDRFSREGVVETLQHLERLKSNGIQWWSFKEEYLRSIGPFAEAVLAILACVAKQERIRLSERVLAGLNRARAKGIRLGRRPAALRSERVREMRQRGLSIRQIAKGTGVSPMTIQRRLAGESSAAVLKAKRKKADVEA
ncbi:MAG: recombinase family protein [Bryobacteraceae bacterium]|jgi:DNA invertase Pin-like site-specific DNA recombinase